MGRTRRSAKDAGTRFETLVVGYLRSALGDDRIERRRLAGAHDRGDVAGVRLHGRDVVVECKDCAQQRMPEWLREAEVERGNADAAYGVVVSKRRGVGDPAEQYVTMTLRTFAAMLAGGPELLVEDEEAKR